MHIAGGLRLRVLAGLLAVARSVAAGAEEGRNQSFLSWLWALVGTESGRLLTQLGDGSASDDAYMICMTEVDYRSLKPFTLIVEGTTPVH